MLHLAFRRQRTLFALLALLIITALPLGKNALQISHAGEEDLLTRLKAAPRLAVEELGIPVRSVRQGMLLWALNPDKQTWDLLQIYFPAYGGPNTIVVIDLGTGQIKQIQTERGWNFHLCPSVQAPNGKLFISILDSRSRQRISVYDPATNELTLDAVAMPDAILGETHPLVMGTDGKLYAIGQHPSGAATAAQIDPDTLKVIAYGPIGPSHAPNAAWGYSGAADDRYIYIASGKIPWYLVAYDRKTGQSTTLVETGTVGGNVSVSQRTDGCFGSASGIVNTDGRRMDYWLYQGQAIPVDPQHKDQPPWLLREPQQSLPARRRSIRAWPFQMLTAMRRFGCAPPRRKPVSPSARRRIPHRSNWAGNAFVFESHCTPRASIGWWNCRMDGCWARLGRMKGTSSTIRLRSGPSIWARSCSVITQRPLPTARFI